jgi:malectin (di-glucose binding ER protein)
MGYLPTTNATDSEAPVLGRRRLQSVIHRLDAERAELELLLTSRTFGRNNNLGRFLGFVCEKYFEGATSEIKEYSIAVQALGRPPDFDPQLDTIVRVTAHNLRKRLDLYYAGDGVDHPVQICLPPGHYVPQFIHRGELGAGTQECAESHEFDVAPDRTLNRSHSTASSPPEPSPEIVRNPVSTGQQPRPRTRNAVTVLALIAISLLATLGFHFWGRRTQIRSTQRAKATPPLLNSSNGGIHALAGADRAPYADRAGFFWQSDHFCSGGSSFSVAGHAVQGTQDPQLFSSGRRGIFQCDYPVPSGSYEIHLLFAETAGLQENSRNVAFSINGGSSASLDVVDDAGGDDIATTKIYTDIEPGKDGNIHIAFTTPESFVNAIEIFPGIPHHMLPVRIAVGHSTYRDGEANVWLPDQYFFGGRLSRFGEDLSKVPSGGLYEWHRFGHFHYIIPVATGAKYALKLHFLEHWFGAQNGGIGGTGSRIFDVSCNGVLLLKNFDIYREAGSEPLVRTFPHIEPTAQGKIELYFTPAVNYPSISAIEVISE